MQRRIVLTGGGTSGHVTPNLALMERLAAEGWRIDYIGSREGVERELVARTGTPFHSISSGKLRRYFDWKNFSDPLRVVHGAWQALRLLGRLKPDVVFSKGGFVAVPVVLAARARGIPIVVHESDMTPGLANRISLPLATRICVAFPETASHVGQRDKVDVTGIPVRKGLLQGSSERANEYFSLDAQRPVLLIFGGSLGARAINEVVRNAAPELLRRFQIVHVCGRGNLPGERPEGYQAHEYLNEEFFDLLARADVVVSRAGATSLFELLTLRKPNILVPLPASVSRGDQILNAASFERQGLSVVLPEERLSVASLVEAVREVYASRAQYETRMSEQLGHSSTDAVLDVIRSAARR